MCSETEVHTLWASGLAHLSLFQGFSPLNEKMGEGVKLIIVYELCFCMKLTLVFYSTAWVVHLAAKCHRAFLFVRCCRCPSFFFYVCTCAIATCYKAAVDAPCKTPIHEVLFLSWWLSSDKLNVNVMLLNTWLLSLRLNALGWYRGWEESLFDNIAGICQQVS